MIAAKPESTSVAATRTVAIRLFMTAASPSDRVARSNFARFVAVAKTKTDPEMPGLFVRDRLPRSPAVPVAMMMVVVMMTMMPAVPTMMVMVAAMEMMAMEMMTVMSPVHFRRSQPGTFLNRRGRARIGERERIRALDRGCEREQCANGRKAQNFR